jgi:transposase
MTAIFHCYAFGCHNLYTRRLAMQKRDRWRNGLMLSKHEIMEIAKARKDAQASRDHEFDRRLRGIELVGKKLYTQESAAEILEVTPNSVTRWVMKYRKNGIRGLHTKKAKGAVAKLSKDDMTKLKVLITEGPEKCGIDTGVWTCATVQKLIQREFGVKHSVSHIRRILHNLGFSVQYPKKVLSEANLDAQKTWLEKTYPAIKKSQK